MRLQKEKRLQRPVTFMLAMVFMLSSLGLIQPHRAYASSAEKMPSSAAFAGRTDFSDEASSHEETEEIPMMEGGVASASGAGEEPSRQFVVRFLDYAGAVIGEPQTVPAGSAAAAPEQVPEPPGELFAGWDTDAYLCVQANLDITAVYGPAAADKLMRAANGENVQLVWTDRLSVSDQSKRYGDPDPRHIVLGLPDGLKEGVDYEVSFGRMDEGEEVRDDGYRVKITSFRFLNPKYELVGLERFLGTGMLYIQRRAVIITARTLAKEYSGTPLTLSGERSISGDDQFAPGDIGTVYLSGSQTNVGSTTNKIEWVSIKNSSGQDTKSNYTVTLVDGTLTVTHASLVIKADNKIIDYGDDEPSHTLTYTGLVNGETSSVLSIQPTVSCTYRPNDLPGAYTITASGAKGENYFITYQPGICTVRANSGQITVTAGNGSKVYDGAPLTKDNYTVSGFEDYEDAFELEAAVSGSITNVAQSGSANNVITSVVVRRKSDSADVTTLFPNIVKVPGALTVTPAPLEAKMQSRTISFGAPAPSSFPVDYTGFVNGETEDVLAGETTAFCAYAQGDVPGPYAITGSGAWAPNYAISYLPGTLTVKNDSTPITVTAASKNKVYDGTPLADDTFIVSGLPAGYTLDATVSGAATGVNDTAAGNNTVSNVSIVRDFDGKDVTAYFSNIIRENGTLAITPRGLVINALDQSVSYGSPPPAYEVEYIGFASGENQSVLTAQPVAFCPYAQGAAPHSYPITLSGADAVNYSISYQPGVLTVTASSTLITVKAANASKVYDGAPLANSAYSVSGLPAGYVLEATVVGSATNVGDTAAGNNIIKSDYTIKTDPGGRDVTAHFPNVELIPGTLSIRPASLTAKAQNYEMKIGGSIPVFEVVYAGFVNNETKDVLSEEAKATCTYTEPRDGTGTYPITLSGAQAANYTIDHLPGVLTVARDNQTIIIQAASTSRVYDGTPLTNSAYTVSGLPAGFTLTADVSGSATNVADSIAGNNEITRFTIWNADNEDTTDHFSDIQLVPGDLAILRRTLMMETESKSIAFGESAPELTIQYFGFAPGEDAASALNGTPVAFSDYRAEDTTGEYLVEIGGGATADNYNILYLYGSLTVHNNNTSIHVVADSARRGYNGMPLEKPTYMQYGDLPAGYSLNVSVSGKITNVDESRTGNNAISSITVTRDAGGEDVTQYFSGITQENGTLAIMPAPLTAKMKNDAVFFGAPVPAYSVVYSGFVNGENTDVLTSGTTPAGDYQQGAVPGVYTIHGSGAAAKNYSISYQSGSLHVTPNYANIIVTAASENKVYDASPLINDSYTVTGLPDGYSVTAVVAGSATTVAGSTPGNNQVTSYAITRDGDGEMVTQYFPNVTKVDGTLSVTPAALVAEMKNITVEYNDEIPVYEVGYAGFAPGENENVLTSPATGSSGYQRGSMAGQYPIAGAGARADNYTISYLPGTLTVTTRDDQIIVTAKSASKQYDGTPLRENGYTYEGLPSNLQIQVAVSGEATAVADSAQGNNRVTDVVILDGTQDVTGNFPNIVRVPGTLSITPAPLSICMDGKEIKFGAAAPAFTADYRGFVNGEDASVLTTPLTAASTYRQGNILGSYPITGSGAEAPNYAISYQAGTLVVTTEDAIVTVEASGASKVYDGKPLRGGEYAYSGLPEGYKLEAGTAGSITQVRESALDRPVTGIGEGFAGYSRIDASSVIIRNENGDDVTEAFPNIVTVPGRLDITPREVMVIAENKSKREGETDPALTAKIENALPGESPHYTLRRAAGEKTGIYSIDVVGGDNPNYTVVGVPGMFTIRQTASRSGDTDGFIIQGTAGPGGAISPAGQTGVAKGGSIRFSFLPGEGYIVDMVLVDGKAVTTDGSSYTLENVGGNHSIHVVFTTPAAAMAKSRAPQTGDRGNLWLWFALAAFSGASLVLRGVHAYKKRASHR